MYGAFRTCVRGNVKRELNLQPQINLLPDDLRCYEKVPLIYRSIRLVDTLNHILFS